MLVVFLFLTGCNGCVPRFPDESDEDPPPDSPPPDSPTDTQTGDSVPALPPRCDVMETERNDNVGLVTPIPMEQWVCGVLEPADPYAAPLGDVEYLSFTTPQPGWVEINLEAAARGSAADMQFVLYDEADSVTVSDGFLTTDPMMRFPMSTPQSFTLVLGETTFLFGDEYDWFLLTSLVKAPVEWSGYEAESNNAYTGANEFTLGQTIFGTIDPVGDLDWYHVVTPPEYTTIRFTTEAFAHGSPVDLTLGLYKADGITQILEDRYGDVDYDRDPWFEQKQTEANEWFLVVRNSIEKGSRFHWYTLKIEGTTE